MWKFLAIGLVLCACTKTVSPAQIIGADQDRKLIYVELSPQLTTSSDGACQAAGMVILTILEGITEPGWQIYVTNEWVPSSKNPIDLEWAKVLAKGY